MRVAGGGGGGGLGVPTELVGGAGSCSEGVAGAADDAATGPDGGATAIPGSGTPHATSSPKVNADKARRGEHVTPRD